MDFKMKSFILILLLLIVGIGSVSASEIDNDNATITNDISTLPNDDLYQSTIDLDDSLEFQDYLEANVSICQENVTFESDFHELAGGDVDSDVIVVSSWDELQYYCSLSDNDYTLKLKENTSFYPTDPNDSNYQIQVYNKVTIIGSEGAYIGYTSSNAPTIKYAAIIVPDGAKAGISMENVNFKWISVNYGSDGVFLQMGGKRNSVFRNCQFSYINTNTGHSCIVYLKKGTATLDNCSFINCTTDFGCVSIYDPNSVTSNDMTVRNCYFEGNYARTEPGCINNCGKVTVYNTTFVKNRSYWWAGAIHTHGGANTTIHDSNFIDNVAGWNGGALYTYSYLQIYNSVFIGNNCTTNAGGGAIGACEYQSNPHIYIENCLFEKNANTNDKGSGGAIAMMDEGSIVVLNSAFIGNSAAHGSAISASAAVGYGSPGVIIANNTFINNTQSEALAITVSGSTAILEGNYFEGNNVKFSELSLKEISSGSDHATLEVDFSLSNPQYYDSDILDKINFDVYVNGEYLKTVDSNVFTVDFDELAMFDVYVIPSISNKKSNSVTVAAVGSFIYVSKSSGNDSNNGTLRVSPVYTLKRALEILPENGSIVILDGIYDEENFQINQDLTILASGNVTLTGKTSFTVNANSFALKNVGVTNLSGGIFIKQNRGNLTISNCVFTNNLASSLIDADCISVSKSIFTNNGAVISGGSFASVVNCVLLNNTELINANDYVVDYNWWGNAMDNLSKPNGLNINNWLVLNATAGDNSLEIDQSSQVQFSCILVEGNKTSRYNDLVKFDLQIAAVNATVDKNILNYNSNLVYTQTAAGASVMTATYNDVAFSLHFDFVKPSPNLVISTQDIMYGQKLAITIVAPGDITDSKGTYRVSVGGYSQSKRTNNNVFSFENLDAGEYVITLVFSGNEKYANQTVTSTVKVNRYESSTKITTGDVVVGSDLTITVTTIRSSTGTVTLFINDANETLILSSNQATYTIKNISRGDYNIRAIYNGNERYGPSEDSVFLEVDNLEPDMTVLTHDSIYGEPCIVDVILNDDAAGFVSVNIQGVSNTSEVVNGKSRVYIYGVDVGVNRTVSVFYTGDNTYFNKSSSANASIFKANLTFEIGCEDIYIGSEEVITIVVPPKTKGAFTINGNVINVPMSGVVSYTFRDLEIGNYTVTAVFEGPNYNVAVNSASFEVMEYALPIWANDGGDTSNTHKSSYEANCSGVSWTVQVNESIISNIVIDSMGNVFISTDDKVYSYDNMGNLRWIYDAGNFSGLAVGRDVIVLPKSGDTLYFINQSSGLKYGHSNIYQASSLFCPVIDANATVYVAGEYQFDSGNYNLVIVPYRLWASGGSPVVISLGSARPVAAPVLNDDVIVVLCEKSLMIFDANTLSLNAIKVGDFKPVRPLIGEGNIVYSILGDSLIAFTNDGVQWGKIIPITGGAGNNLLIDNERGVYASNAEGKLFRYDVFTGEEFQISDLKVTSGILIDDAGNLYFASDNVFYGINPEGDVLWKVDLDSSVTGSPVMDSNGTIYVTTSDNRLLALSNVVLKDPDLGVNVSDITEGENLTVNVTIDGEATGRISFALNGIAYDELVNNGSVVKVISGLPVGNYTVKFTYGGDWRFNETSVMVTFTVRAKPAPVVVNPVLKAGNLVMLYTSNSYYKVRLTQNGAPLTGKTVTFTLNGKKLTAKTNANGYAVLKISLPPKTYAVTAQYGKVKTSSRITVKSIITAKNIVAKKSAKAMKIRVALSRVNGKYLAGRLITLKFSKFTFRAKTNAKGVALFTIKSAYYKNLAANRNYVYQATYLKDTVKRTVRLTR